LQEQRDKSGPASEVQNIHGAVWMNGVNDGSGYIPSQFDPAGFFVPGRCRRVEIPLFVHVSLLLFFFCFFLFFTSVPEVT
jgi:hypothetical protein